MKHTKEILEPLVRESLSYAEVVRKLGLKNANGGTQAHIKKRIKKFGLDTSHFLGQARNRGLTHVGGNKKLHWSKILILNRSVAVVSTASAAIMVYVGFATMAHAAALPNLREAHGCSAKGQSQNQ
jgi:hypothetical protein